MQTLELIEKIEQLYLSWGYAILFLSSFIETTPFGWTIPGGTMIAVGGFFAYGGKISLIGVVVAGWLGMYLVFLLAYFLGNKTGEKLAHIFHQERGAQRAKQLLENYGPIILTTSLLANLTRFWVAYIAGSQRYNRTKFVFYSGVASLTWSSLLSIIGYLAGSKRGTIEKGLTQLGIFSWILLVAAIAIIFWLNKKEYEQIDKK